MDSINLLKENEDFWSDKIEERLKEAECKKCLVYTNHLRCVGKTTKLIEFAKKNNYYILKKNNVLQLKKDFDYDRIIYFNENTPDKYRGLRCVIDEEITNIPNWLEPLIVTGLTYNIKPVKDYRLFNTKIVRALNSEIELLLDKIEVMNKNNKDSDYKMLINNLEKTIFVRDNVMRTYQIK